MFRNGVNMKLAKLYSNDNRFKTVRFNPQFNIVLGELTNVSNLNYDSHNLGKSTLIYLIDFMLLKELKNGDFLKKDEFSNHVFFLEIKVNSGKYVTIKRAIKNNTKISIKIHEDEMFDGINCSNWDYENLSLGSSDENINPRKILNRLLNFTVLPKEEYRKTSGYFLRTQDDYKDVFKLQKYKGKDIYWKPILFELLGFYSEHMINKYNIESEIEAKEQLIQKVKNEFNVDAGEKDRIQGLIDIEIEKKKEIEEWLDRFDFYNKEAGLNKEAIEEVEFEISKLNTERYNLEFEIQQIEESLKVKVDYRVEDVLELYEEVGIYFPQQLVKEYHELIDFNKKVSAERMKYLDKSKHEKIERMEKINADLIIKNDKRQELLSVLRGTNTFSKYNVYRNDLVNVERKIERYLSELDGIDHVKRIQDDIKLLKDKLRHETDLLVKQVDESTVIYKCIRKDFHDFVNEILDNNAMISLNINGNENVDFLASFYNVENEETAQGMGHTYKKLLCACFDLAVIKNYMNKSFYRFIYHDGCLESLDPRKQKKYLNLVRRISKEYDMQYIMTCLSSDIPDGEAYQIVDSEIAVTLSDADDDSGRLFGFAF